MSGSYIFFTTLVIFAASQADSNNFLQRQRELAEEVLASVQANDIDYVETFTSQPSDFAESSQASDENFGYAYTYTDIAEETDVSSIGSNSEIFTEGEISTSGEDNEGLGVIVDESINPFKTKFGFYSKINEFGGPEPYPSEFQSINFMKELILRFSCFQQGYLIEDGEVYTEEEMAIFIAEQEARARELAIASGEPFDDFELEDDAPVAANTSTNSTSSTVPLGPNCSKLVCGSCKAVLDEFAKALHRAAGDQHVKHIGDVAVQFCSTKEIVLKYLAITEFVCLKMFERFSGYVLRVLAKDVDWKPNVHEIPRIFEKKKEICESLGFCTPESFRFDSQPTSVKQEHWTPICYVCRHMASDIEERVVLTQTVTEGLAEQIVGDVCGRVALPEELTATCKHILDEKIIDMSWIAKLHAETIWKRVTAPDMMFPERICIEVGFCEKWVDPEAKARKEAELEAAFW